MASLGHVAVGVAAARAHHIGRPPPWSAMAAWSALSLLPDADVIGFAFGVAYADPWGHRGATHSFVFSLLTGAAAGLSARLFGRPFGRTALIATLVIASHAVLDTLTDGGLGCALLWPFDETRYFAPWRPIPVAPIGFRFISPMGLLIALTELVLFAPLLLFALWHWRGASKRTAFGFFLVLWTVCVWLMTSGDPAREALVGSILREDTVYASGFSEQRFRDVNEGDSDANVQQLLGAPFSEVWIYGPGGASAAVDRPASELVDGCRGINLENGVVVAALESAACRRLGIQRGSTRDDVRRVLGPPPESCWRYTRNPRGGRYRMRMVCFTGTAVQTVFRRWE